MSGVASTEHALGAVESGKRASISGQRLDRDFIINLSCRLKSQNDEFIDAYSKSSPIEDLRHSHDARISALLFYETDS